jgi:hypothetical protein
VRKAAAAHLLLLFGGAIVVITLTRRLFVLSMFFLCSFVLLVKRWLLLYCTHLAVPELRSILIDESNRKRSRTLQ